MAPFEVKHNSCMGHGSGVRKCSSRSLCGQPVHKAVRIPTVSAGLPRYPLPPPHPPPPRVLSPNLTYVNPQLSRGHSPLMSFSDTGCFINLQYTNIFASRSPFSKHPGSGVNLIPEYDSLSSEYHIRNPPTSEGLRHGSRSFSEL